MKQKPGDLIVVLAGNLPVRVYRVEHTGDTIRVERAFWADEINDPETINLIGDDWSGNFDDFMGKG